MLLGHIILKTCPQERETTPSSPTSRRLGNTGFIFIRAITNPLMCPSDMKSILPNKWSS
jgi:hypothetical protein